MNDDIEKFIEINNVKFYYNPNEMKITDKIMNKIQKFCADENEEAYSMYIDESQGLVIY